MSIYTLITNVTLDLYFSAEGFNEYYDCPVQSKAHREREMGNKSERRTEENASSDRCKKKLNQQQQKQ